MTRDRLRGPTHWPAVAGAIPNFVQTPEDSKRWALCQGIAAQLLDELPESGQVWSMARVLYHSELPT